MIAICCIACNQLFDFATDCRVFHYYPVTNICFVKVIRHAELVKLDPSLDDQAHRENFEQFRMSDEAHDGRNVALNCQVYHGVLNRPKKDQVK